MSIFRVCLCKVELCDTEFQHTDTVLLLKQLTTEFLCMCDAGVKMNVSKLCV